MAERWLTGWSRASWMQDNLRLLRLVSGLLSPVNGAERQYDAVGSSWSWLHVAKSTKTRRGAREHWYHVW